MSEEKASVQMLKYLELTDGEDKDKDKMTSNEFKVLFNISSPLKDQTNPNTSESAKKPKNKIIKKNHSLLYKNSFTNKRYNIININKETSYDDMLTIINTSKKNTNNSLAQKNRYSNSNPINALKKKMRKVDLFNSMKYKNIKPKKNFSFKNCCYLWIKWLW